MTHKEILMAALAKIGIGFTYTDDGNIHLSQKSSDRLYNNIFDPDENVALGFIFSKENENLTHASFFNVGDTNNND